MRRFWWVFLIFVFLSAADAEDMTGKVKKAVERSTLNQPGTKPFHLKAVLAPSFERDKGSGRSGNIEIWWASPSQWKREIRSPEFHQIEIVSNGHDWQKNEGDYFPEWLRETAVQLVNPLPELDQVLDHVKTAENRNFTGQINIDWSATTGTAEARNIQRYSVGLELKTGLLLYTYGFGWGAAFKDYHGFHGLMVARTLEVGTPQLTAKVQTLDDLGDVPARFFEADL